MSFSNDEIREWRAEYHPCALGLHIFDPDEGSHGGLTVENFTMESASQARQLFSECRRQCECSDGEPEDYLVDLFVDEYTCEDNFYTSHQMLPRLAAIIWANVAITRQPDGTPRP